MKNPIVIILFVLINLCLLSCKQNKKSCIIEKSFVDLIEENIKDSLATNFSNGNKVISFYFYEVDSNPYMAMGTDCGFSKSLMKSYSSYKDIMLAYYGFNDSIAGKFVDLECFKSEVDSGMEDMNLDNGDCSELMHPYRHYSIKNNKFDIYKADSLHRVALYNILVENRFLPPLPPPPPALYENKRK